MDEWRTLLCTSGNVPQVATWSLLEIKKMMAWAAEEDEGRYGQARGVYWSQCTVLADRLGVGCEGKQDLQYGSAF